MSSNRHMNVCHKSIMDREIFFFWIWDLRCALSYLKKKGGGERSRKFLGKSNNFYINRDEHKNMLFAGTGKDEYVCEVWVSVNRG